MSNCDCRPIVKMDELEKVVDLEIKIWGLDPRDAVPGSILHAMVVNGGLLAGAYDNAQLIGLALAFPIRRDKNWMLWSHMTGSHPEYQGKGIGFALKQFQRTWALEHGYHAIGWTYDPLQRGNANFNLHYLGATSNTYLEDFYGEMTDAINIGLPSDRLEVIWKLKQPRVRRLAAGKQSIATFALNPNNEIILLRESAVGVPTMHIPAEMTANFYLAQIPHSINSIKSSSLSLALEWRLALRKAFQAAFQNGYQAEDFVEIDGAHFYVFAASPAWYLYVLECSDKTLYTGITPDLEKRLVTHNLGRGAAYTASRRPVKLIASWKLATKQSAMRAERAFKTLKRSEKLRHINSKIPFDGVPFYELE